jgi:hypothetical protein
MANDVAKTQTINIVPVQGIFLPEPTFDLVTLIGPAGTPFYANVNPDQSGLHITNSTIDSTTIGATTPSTGVFTNIATTTGTISSLPSSPDSIVNQAYVDAIAQGLAFKQPANYATTGNITLSGLAVQAGGDWTSALTAGMRVLVLSQTTQADNGIYVAASGAWARSADANTYDELLSAYLFVLDGATLAGSAWVDTNLPGGTLGVTAITFVRFSNTAIYTAGTGLTLSSYQFSITPVGTAGTYGSASQVPVFTTNASGQVTSVTNTNIAIANTAVSGLGTMSTQNANSVAITGGTIDGTTIGGSTAAAVTGTVVTANSYFSGAGTNLTGTASGLSIGGNAATATTAGSATTATNLAGGATGSLPYQSAPSATTFLSAGSNGQVLTLASGVPSWATPTTGTVTSVSGTGTVSGISLSGTVTSSGSLTLGGTLDLSSPPPIGGTTPNTAKFTTGLVGANANFTDFPNAQFISSQANTGSAHIYNIGVAGEGVATDVAGGGQWGVGVYGTGATVGATRGIGIVGDGHVSNTADTAAAIGVRGYATQIHSGGQNIGLYAQATGGASNYALFMASGNIYSAIDQTWAVNDNSASALSIDATGKAGIWKIITTNSDEGVSTSGKIDIAGSIGLGSSPSYGLSGQVLTSAGAGSTPTWSTPSGSVTVSDDTTTATALYPLFSSVTTGAITTEYVSSTKLQYVPSTGVLTSTSFSGAGTGLTGTATSLSIGGNAATATSATSATTATNIAGGTANQIPYQTGAGATSYIVAPTTSSTALTWNGTAFTWATAGTAVTISDDTTTNAVRYPLFANATTGTVSTEYVSSTKYQYNPSTGELTAPEVISSNGIMVNSQTVSADYTIATGNNGLSAGSVSVASGITVTIASGSVWTVV